MPGPFPQCSFTGLDRTIGVLYKAHKEIYSLITLDPSCVVCVCRVIYSMYVCAVSMCVSYIPCRSACICVDT